MTCSLFILRTCKIVFCFILLFTIQSSVLAQLTNWQYYYKSIDLQDGGNFLYNITPATINVYDKATKAYSSIPLPAAYRDRDYHDGGDMHCFITKLPNNRLILASDYNMSLPLYEFDGVSFIPFYADFLGFNYNYIKTQKVNNNLYIRSTASIYFDTLYKYDGVSITKFSANNSPIDNSTYDANIYGTDIIVLNRTYSLATFNNGVWKIYDTIFLGGNYDIQLGNSTSDNNNNLFFDKISSKFWFYNGTTDTLTSFILPSAMNHSSQPLYNVLVYGDEFGDFWINKDSVLVKFNGTTFTDYFTTYTSLYQGNKSNNYLSMFKDSTAPGFFVVGDSLIAKYNGTTFTDLFTPFATTFNWLQNKYIIDFNYAPHSFFVKDYLKNNYYIYNYLSNTIDTIAKHTNDVLPTNIFYLSNKDNQNNLWFGGFGGPGGIFDNLNLGEGLVKLTPNGQWINYALDSLGINNGVYQIVKDTGNAMAFGVMQANKVGPHQISGTTAKCLLPTSNFVGYATALAIDTAHNYWYGGLDSTLASLGVTSYLYKLTNNTVSTYYNPAPLLGAIKFMAIDSFNNKWLKYANGGGVYKFDGSTFTLFDMSNSGLPSDDIEYITTDPYSTAVWFITSNGFAKYYNGTWSVLDTTNSGLPNNNGEYMYFMPDGTTWFGCRGGFAYYNNTTWDTYTTYNSPLCNRDVESIQVDSNCKIWLVTEGGIQSADLPCANQLNKGIAGKVKTYNGAPATDVVVNLYQYQAKNNDVVQISNTTTNSKGEYTFTVNDTGRYYVQAILGNNYTDNITAYTDSQKVITNAKAIQIVDTTKQIANITFCKKLPQAGNCSLKGKLVSDIEGYRVGSNRLVLMKDSAAVVSKLTNKDGTFEFTNLDGGTYTIWLDRLTANNKLAPTVNVNCTKNQSVTINTNLYSVLSVSNTTNNSFIVYPNPCNNYLQVSFLQNISKSIPIEIYDVTGQKIVHHTLNTNTGIIDVHQLQPGLYLLKCSYGIVRFSKQ